MFQEARRVLASHGTLWLNLGDSYSADHAQKRTRTENYGLQEGIPGSRNRDFMGTPPGLKPKDLVGIPWRVAFALQDDGWYLRSDIIWAKPNPMPQSVSDRPTSSHEYVFLMTKNERYYFDQEAVREPQASADRPQARRAAQLFEQAGLTDAHLRAIRSVGITDVGKAQVTQTGFGKNTAEVQRLADEAKEALGGYYREFLVPVGRNVRSVWEIATESYPDAHFATFPTKLVEKILLAGCPLEVCVTCGKPRVRLTEKESLDGDLVRKQTHGASGKAGRVRGGTDDADTTWSHRTTEAGTVPSFKGSAVETIGWSDCGHGNYRPGIVLDPFMGSGTTALVARKLARHAVGIELSEEYAKLAAARLSQLSLFAEPVVG